MTKLSDRLRFLRKQAGFTQYYVADRLGISRSAMGMYETGQREPNLETLEAFADFYNVSMNVLGGPLEQSERRVVSDDDLMFALWGGREGVDANDLKKVLEYAAFIKAQKGRTK